MADGNNENMAMEDILSSIKNILEEDAYTQQSSVAVTANPSESAAVLEQPIQENDFVDDDILDLSADMKIEDVLGLNDNAENIISEEVADFEINNNEAVPEKNTLSSVDVGVGFEDVESDPFDADGAPEHNKEIQEEPIIDVIAESTPIVEADIVVEPEPIRETEPIANPESIVEKNYETEAEQSVVIQPAINIANEKAIDVSAGIINNFTKMFSRAETTAQMQPSAPVVAETINLIGDGSKTIEDVVVNVIRNIIGKEVEQNWRGKADYDSYAREVISAQAKAWLDENLPKVVESIVKREIEQVMAKVGRNQ